MSASIFSAQHFRRSEFSFRGRLRHVRIPADRAPAVPHIDAAPEHRAPRNARHRRHQVVRCLHRFFRRCVSAGQKLLDAAGYDIATPTVAECVHYCRGGRGIISMGRMDRPAFASRPQPAHDVGILLSDAERANAMSALGHAFSQGRLTIDEYDSRCQKIAQARTRGDVEKHFVDLPEDWRRVATASSAVSRLYTAEEITQARQRGSHPRLALMLLTSIGALGAMSTSSVCSRGFCSLFRRCGSFFMLQRLGLRSGMHPANRQFGASRRAAFARRRICVLSVIAPSARKSATN